MPNITNGSKTSPVSLRADLPSRSEAGGNSQLRNAAAFMRMATKVSVARLSNEHVDDRNKIDAKGQHITKRKMKRWVDFNRHLQRRRDVNPRSTKLNDFKHNSKVGSSKYKALKLCEKSTCHLHKHSKCKADSMHDLDFDKQKKSIEKSFNDLIGICYKIYSEKDGMEFTSENSSLIERLCVRSSTAMEKILISMDEMPSLFNVTEQERVNHGGNRTKRSFLSDLAGTSGVLNELESLLRTAHDLLDYLGRTAVKVVTNTGEVLENIGAMVETLEEGAINTTDRYLDVANKADNLLDLLDSEVSQFSSDSTEFFNDVKTHFQNIIVSLMELISIGEQSTHNVTKAIIHLQEEFDKVLKKVTRTVNNFDTFQSTVANELTDTIKEFKSAVISMDTLLRTLPANLKSVDSTSVEAKKLLKSLNLFVQILMVVIPATAVLSLSVCCYKACRSKNEGKCSKQHPDKSETNNSRKSDKTKQTNKSFFNSKAKIKKEILKEIQDDMHSLMLEYDDPEDRRSSNRSSVSMTNLYVRECETLCEESNV